MFGRRRGTWIQFDAKNSDARTITLGSTCTSTSAESAGHFQSVISSGRIAGVNDLVKEIPQIPQARPELVQA
jgi:hypothetical protein